MCVLALLGCGAMCQGVVGSVLLSELTSPEYRSHTTSIASTFMTFGVAFSALVAYYFRESWRAMTLALSSYAAVGFVVIWA